MNQASNASAPVTNRLAAHEGFKVWRPGTMAYRDAQARQETLVTQRLQWSYDLLVLLQHPAVVTLGRSANLENLLWNQEQLQNAGIDCVASRRGGDITLHGPGQLVGYPIVDLHHYQRDLHRFLRLLEEVLICTLADFDLVAMTLPGKTGVWIDGRKIASIGIAVRNWISYHGFALNIDNDLTLFQAIVPCGLHNVAMTSMSRELGRPIDYDAVSESLVGHFGNILQQPLLGDYDEKTTTQT